MRTILIVGVGSFLGGGLRHLLTEYMQSRIKNSFPVSTFMVNLIGCFAIGIVFGLVSKSSISGNAGLFLSTGLLGGFTTFSAFSLQTAMLLKSGQAGYAIAYVCASVLLGLAATFMGILIVTKLYLSN